MPKVHHKSTPSRPVVVQDICSSLNRWAPAELAYSWDRIGLQVGNPTQSVKRVITCLSVVDAVVKEAIARRCDMIVSHHALIWEPLRTLCTDDSVSRRVAMLIKNNIACFNAHTNLDVAEQGLNAHLARKLGLENPKGLLTVPHATQFKVTTFVPESHLQQVRDAMCTAGAGIIGEYSFCSFSTPGHGTFLPSEAANPFSGRKGTVNEEPERRLEVLVPKHRLSAVLAAMRRAHPYEEPAYDVYPLHEPDPRIRLGVSGTLKKPSTLKQFAQTVRRTLRVPFVRVVGEPKRLVSRVAVIGGAGASFVGDIPKDIDVLVTGDVGYHDALKALDGNLAVVDAGHCGTERFIAEAMTEHIRTHFPSLEVFTFIEEEPFQVFC